MELNFNKNLTLNSKNPELRKKWLKTNLFIRATLEIIK